MAKNKEYFYVAKGKYDEQPWLFYGTKPPYINNTDKVTWHDNTKLVGGFTDNPIIDSLKDNEVIKVYIRVQTIKKK